MQIGADHVVGRVLQRAATPISWSLTIWNLRSNTQTAASVSLNVTNNNAAQSMLGKGFSGQA
jgi:hypothetical protein